MTTPILNIFRVDSIEIAGKRTPGRARIINATRSRKWDVQGGFGIGGGSLNLVGEEPAKFTLEVDLWTDEHMLQWLDFAQILKRPPLGVSASALRVVSPHLSDLGIIDAVVEAIHQFEQRESGMLTKVIDFLEWRKPVKMLGRPNGAIPNAEKKEPSARDAADREIDALSKTFNEELAK